jgi:hypothetical protein
MNKLQQVIPLASSVLTHRNIRIIAMIITIALFVLSAGAPNATIGIGK